MQSLNMKIVSVEIAAAAVSWDINLAIGSCEVLQIMSNKSIVEAAAWRFQQVPNRQQVCSHTSLMSPIGLWAYITLNPES